MPAVLLIIAILEHQAASDVQLLLILRECCTVVITVRCIDGEFQVLSNELIHLRTRKFRVTREYRHVGIKCGGRVIAVLRI